MEFTLEAERVILKVIDESYAKQLLLFYMENADVFMNVEQDYPDNFFTEDYQTLLIKGYFQQFVDLKAFRYFVFTKEDPATIIGCVGISNYNPGPDKTGKVYYKLDRLHTGQGYATEALSCLLWHAANSLGLHRVEADILPENQASRAVVKRLGFELEGVAKQSHNIHGEWKDHERWAIIL